MKRISLSALFLNLFLISTLTSCRDALVVYSEYTEAEEKLISLKAEQDDLTEKMTVLKQVLPPLAASSEGAASLREAAEKNHAIIDQQLTQATTSYQEMEGALKAVDKEIEALRVR